MDKPRKYQPSNGTEGMMFCEDFCEHCRHERFMHSQDHDDIMCQIFSDSLVYDVKDEKYPNELVYDKNDRPTCTKYEHYEWFDDLGNLKEAFEKETKDPNQLSLF